MALEQVGSFLNSTEYFIFYSVIKNLYFHFPG